MERVGSRSINVDGVCVPVKAINQKTFGCCAGAGLGWRLSVGRLPSPTAVYLLFYQIFIPHSYELWCTQAQNFENVPILTTNPSRTFSQKLGMQGHGWLERRTSHTSAGACLIRGPVFDQHIILFFRSYSVWAVVPNFLWLPILEQISA